ncbi:MAG: AAA family ATPase [Firmicutes bacterium]|nr:AAA family ATPase [Bacillota bacterium]
MSKIIAVANQKGGVGKTTTSVNLAAFVALMGRRVLLVDIDPQGNTSSGLGVEKNKLEASIYDAIVGDAEASDVVVPTTVKNLAVLPSHITMAGLESEMVNLPNREKILRTILTPMRNHFDYIFIDCPPSLGLLTVNALTAADSVLIPIPGEFFALEGLSQLMNTIKLAKQHLNQQLEVEGVLFTLFDARSNLANSVADEVIRFFGAKVFNTRIPRNIRLGEAPSFGLPIMQFDPKSTGSVSHLALAIEFLNRCGDTKYNKITNLNSLKVKL